MGKGVCDNSTVAKASRVNVAVNVGRGSRVTVAVLARLATGVGVVWDGCELISLGEIQLATITITKM